MRHTRMILLLAGSTLITGCGAAMIGGGPTLDVGSYEVSEADPGLGGRVEAGGYFGPGATGLGAFVGLDLLGYSSAGDADPIFLLTAEGRVRKLIGPHTAGGGLYYALGAGAGTAAVAGLRSLVIPLSAELGYQIRSGVLVLAVGLRERPVLLYSGGSPPMDVVNSVQALVQVGLAR